MAVRGGAVPRFGVLCALLLGLFLMHGSPAAAVGCHRAAAVDAHRPDVSRPDVHRLDPHRHPAGTPANALTVQRADGLCVAARGRAEGASLPQPGPAPLGTVATPPAGGAAPPAVAASGCRAPPDRGREVLLQVCVSRT